MKKTFYILAFFSLFISFTACNDSKKTDATNTEINTTTETTNADGEKAITTSKQKIEKLEAAEFKLKMISLQVYNLVDVRTPQEYAQASIPKSQNINFNADSFEEELGKLERQKPLFIFCKSGGRSARAVKKAKQMGFERIIELDGGMNSWKTAKIETAHGI